MRFPYPLTWFSLVLLVRYATRVYSAGLSGRGGYTPTPVISHAILSYNKGRTKGLADGVVITPSHNPPDNGGFKYNPPNGGPADTDITKGIQDRANDILRGGAGNDSLDGGNGNDNLDGGVAEPVDDLPGPVDPDVPERLLESGRCHDDGSAGVVLGRHGGNTPVMGACAGARGTAVATVQGDGVVVYDCDTQSKTRSWAVGRVPSVNPRCFKFRSRSRQLVVLSGPAISTARIWRRPSQLMPMATSTPKPWMPTAP